MKHGELFGQPYATVVIAFGSLVTAVVAVVALILAIGADAQLSPGKIAEIRSEVEALINMEATAALTNDVDTAVSLFAPDAKVRDALGEMANVLADPSQDPTTWIGTDAIRERYTNLPVFEELVHTDISVIVDPAGISAWAEASTSGIIENENGTKTGISSILGEKWTFEKLDGRWLVKTWSYNLR